MENQENKSDTKKKIPKKYYESELNRLQIELVKLQEWIKRKGLKVVVIFEGRDAAGKGGTTIAASPRQRPGNIHSGTCE